MMDNYYPFNSIGAAIGFYKRRNPARLKQQILDKEREKEPHSDFDPEGTWAAVCLAIKAVLEAADYEQRVTFEFYYLFDTDIPLGVEDIARHLHVGPRRIYRALERVRTDFENELIRRELMPPPRSEDGGELPN